MGFVSLELWLGKLILVILFLDGFAACASLPRKEYIGNPKNDVGGAHHWFGREGHTVPRRSRSDLEVSPSQVNGSVEAEMLLEFRKGIALDPFNILSSWNSNNISNCCSWPGVHCSNQVGQVTGLNLSGNLLKGTISSSLGGLEFLSSLDLSNNFFEGLIPTSIANCSSLTVLDLSYNAVDGSIPTELTTLLNLEELYLSSNALTGVIPPSLSNLSALRVLSLGTNQILGNIMSLAWDGLGQLERLNLSVNLISGAIPESLSNCSSLVELSLSSNKFSGDLMSLDWGAFGQSLKTLALDNNNISGAIPRSLSNCSSLVDLYLNANNFTGTITEYLGKLHKLQTLYLGYNFLTGFIPASLVNCSSLSGLFLHFNLLTGELPAEIGLLSRLQDIYVYSNTLTGSIPTSLLNCTSLSAIVLSMNFFTGEIPQTLGRLSELSYLYLDNNHFEGGIPVSLGNSSTILKILLNINGLTGRIPPQLGLLHKLSVLDLSSNFLSGQIPASLGNSTPLNSLFLATNQLSGPIPSSIGELTNVQGLDLSDNLLTGRIPVEFSNLSLLSLLNLNRNLLNDSIPDELGNLVALNLLYLNNNNFTGSISFAFRQELKNLVEISVAYNSLTGTIDGYDFGLVRSLQQSFDLSHNLFSGPLPPSIGALEFVQKINLSFNAFSGPITGALSKCTGLESLDLSSNILDGEIPQSLTTLQYLTYFNVSFNQLTGSIPESGQFANFDNESFLGNPNLCSPMLPHKCNSSSHGIRRVWSILVPTVVSSIAVVLALAALWFLFIAKRRDLSASRIAQGLSDASETAINGTHKMFSRSLVLQTLNDPCGQNVIGIGAKSIVYKGVLPGGKFFAVKKLLPNNEDHDSAKPSGSVDDLVKEAEILAKLRHKNILKCLTFYSSLDFTALILEYMSGGSLHKHLHELEPCKLTWQTRLKVAMGVAQGMKYLHHDFPEPLIHRDLKPRNILLDAEFEPKVADFGISKFVRTGKDGEASASTFCGTIGYMPPEYASQPWVSTKGDVYSYGIVVIELLTRRQPCLIDAWEDPCKDLRNWVSDNFQERSLGLLDTSLIRECARNDIAMEQMMLLLRVSVFCTSEGPQSRPSMINVVGMLTDIVNLGAEPVRRTLDELASDIDPTCRTTVEEMANDTVQTM